MGARALGSHKAAALFALLVTSPGCRCSREEIADALWEGDETGRGRVDWAVTRLRKVLGEECVPHAGKSGYCVLRLPAESVDYLRFKRERERAESLPWPERYESLRTAEAEWGADEPLLGLPGRRFHVHRERMKTERMAVVDELLTAALKSGQEKCFLDEADKRFAQFPANPVVFRHYLLAHGLEMPDDERERLISRWSRRSSAPPDSELEAVIRRLRGETPASKLLILPPVPDQMPSENCRLVGREALIRKLVAETHAEQDAGRNALILLTGMAGVGKSSVARHLAWQLRDRFPDGVLYGELDGFREDRAPVEPEHILDNFLAELPPHGQAVGEDGKSAALRSALARRSTLVVLDDAASAQQVNPLLPGAGTSTVIVTSRTELSGLSQKNVISCRIESLTDEDALEVLQERVPEKQRAGRALAYRELVRLCGNLPLALTAVARRLDNCPAATLHALVREMKEESERLNALHVPEHEISVRVALNCSIRALSDEAKLFLWQLAVHPGPSMTWEAAMDIGSAIGGMRADRTLPQLAAVNLVEVRHERYRLHDLVRLFARHHLRPMAIEQDPAIEERTVRQILEHQLHNVRACDRILDRQRSLPVGEPDGVTVAEPADPEEAMALLDQEYDTVQACVDLAVNRRAERYMWLLPMALVTYRWRRGRIEDACRDLRTAAEIAKRVASPVDCAMVLRNLAGTEWRLAMYDLAAVHLGDAVRLSRQNESASGRLSLARSLYALALTLRKQNREAEAEAQLLKALTLYQELPDPVGRAAALNAVGALHYDRGRYTEALHWCGDALRVVERTTDRAGHADVLFTLAKVHIARSERDEAIGLYERACALYREQEYWPDEVKVRRLFAEVLVAAGRVREAIAELERILVLSERMESADVREIRELLEGLR